ncbi:hypothetical protein BDV93DRAFT_10555 [Ceratobasidium sp. AG-I]|nr:hypothetical protein BDV93DRAFT_10555 [Ceratobasidium sp. AG-I]
MAPQTQTKPRSAPKFNAAHLDPHRGKSCFHFRQSPTINCNPCRAARKLKKDWLATQKIKASYRAEKRRLGLGNTTALTSSTSEDNDVEIQGSAADGQPPDDAPSDIASGRPSLGDDQSSRPHPIAETTESIQSGGGSSTARPKRKEKKDVSSQPVPASATPSLRAMAREAYSPASLHTHKSNPLHRRQQGKDYARRRVEAAGRGAGPTRGGSAKGGRGQPDMAKRMGVLLEKIKRTT